jgi:alanine racemase
MVTLLGDGITVDELAHHFGTIGYEVLTSLGRRYARVYKGGNVVEPPDPPAPAPAAAQPPSLPAAGQPASPPPLPT